MLTHCGFADRQRLRHRSGLSAAFIILGLLLFTPRLASAAAAPAESSAEAEAIYARMLEVVAPERTVVGRVRLTTETAKGETHRYDALVARRRFEDGPRTTVALLGPDAAEGAALLWGTTRANGEPVEAIYGIAENRVREIAPVMPDDVFLSSDFTRADLGFVARGPMTFEYLGETEVNGREVYEILAKPRDSWYYSRIYTWVDRYSYVPVRREYYDRAGRLWKRANYESVTVNDMPAITRITMEDVQDDSRSDLLTLEMRVIENDGEELFRRTYLPRVAAQIRDLLAAPVTQDG